MNNYLRCTALKCQGNAAHGGTLAFCAIHVIDAAHMSQWLDGPTDWGIVGNFDAARASWQRMGRPAAVPDLNGLPGVDVRDARQLDRQFLDRILDDHA